MFILFRRFDIKLSVFILSSIFLFWFNLRPSASFLAADEGRLASSFAFQSIESVVEYGLIHNTRLKSAKALWEASLFQPSVLGSIPDPMVGIRLNGAPSKSGASFDQTRFVAAQSFPFFGTLAHLKTMGNAVSELTYLDYLIEKNKVTLAIYTTVFHSILNAKLTQIALKNKAILEHLVAISDVKYQSGIGLQANVLKAKVARDRLDEELLNLSIKSASLEASLNQLLNIPTASYVFQFEYPDRDVQLPDDSQQLAWVPLTLAVRRAQAASQAAESQLSVAQDRRSPYFSAQVEYWDNAVMDNQLAGQLMMTVPWFNRKNSAGISEASFKSSSSVSMWNDSQTRALSQLSTWVTELTMTLKLLNLYETSLLKNSQLALSNYQKAYEVDKASFVDYFDAQQQVYQLEKQYALYQSQYFSALYSLKLQFETGELPHD